MGFWLRLLHTAGRRSSQDAKSQVPSCEGVKPVTVTSSTEVLHSRHQGVSPCCRLCRTALRPLGCEEADTGATVSGSRMIHQTTLQTAMTPVSTDRPRPRGRPQKLVNNKHKEVNKPKSCTARSVPRRSPLARRPSSSSTSDREWKLVRFAPREPQAREDCSQLPASVSGSTR